MNGLSASTIVVTDTNGAVIQRVVYRPYGQFVQGMVGGSAVAPEFGFTGQHFFKNSALYNYGARWYEPALGRFVQPDAIVGDAFNPQDLNRYAYVRNNPLNRIDPTGNSSIGDFFGGVGDFVSGVATAVGGIVMDVFGSAGGFLDDYFVEPVRMAVTAFTYPFDWLPFLVADTSGTAAAKEFGTFDKIQLGLGALGLIPALGIVPDLLNSGISVGRGNFGDAGLSLLAAVPVIGIPAGGVRVGRGMREIRRGRELLTGTKAGGQTLRAFTSGNFRTNLALLSGKLPSGAHAHHVLPQKFRRAFERAGMNIHDPKFGAWWEKGSHLQNASRYNREWQQFLRGGQRSADDILQFGRDISSRYGLEIFF